MATTDFFEAYKAYCLARAAGTRPHGPSYESHHIRPKSTDDMPAEAKAMWEGCDKYADLTAKEHVYAHFLLDLALMERGEVELLNKISFVRRTSGSNESNFYTRPEVTGRLRFVAFIEGDAIEMTPDEAVTMFCFVTRKSPYNIKNRNTAFTKIFNAVKFGTSIHGYGWGLAFVDREPTNERKEDSDVPAQEEGEDARGHSCPLPEALLGEARNSPEPARPEGDASGKEAGLLAEAV